MKRFFCTNHRVRTGGFSLVEVVLAVSIVAVTFLAILGTLGVGITNDQASSQQTIATNIAASIAADLRSTPSYATPPTPTSQRYLLALPTTPVAPGTPAPLAGVNPVALYFDDQSKYLGVATQPTAIYSANVYVSELAALPQPTYIVRINVSWPAQRPANASPVGSVDVVTQFISHY